MQQLQAKGHNGQIEIEGDWLVIRRKGGLAKLTQGLKGEKRIPMANITSVQFKPATIATNGYVQFSLLGSSETKGGIMDAVKDENTVMFRKSQAAEFEAIRTFVESYIGARIAPAASAGTPDVADQIRKLAELRDLGVLTADEFDAKKSDLLARL